MIEPEITRGSPLGCIVGLIGILPLGLAGIGAYGLVRWFSITPEKRNPDHLSLFSSCLIGGLLLGAALVWLAVRLLRRTDGKSYDRGKPSSLQ